MKRFIISNLKIDDLAFWECVFNKGCILKNIEFTFVSATSGLAFWYSVFNNKFIIEGGQYKELNVFYCKIEDMVVNGGGFRNPPYKDWNVFTIRNSNIKNRFQINNALFDGTVILGDSDEKDNYIHSLEINGGIFNSKFRTESIFGSFKITGGLFNGFVHLVYGVFNEDFIISGGEFTDSFLSDKNVFKKDFILSGTTVFIKELDLGVKKLEGTLQIKDVQHINIIISKGTYHSIYLQDSVFEHWVIFNCGKVTDTLDIENCVFKDRFSGFAAFSYNALYVKDATFFDETLFVHLKHKTVTADIRDSKFNNELSVWLNAENICFSNIQGVTKLDMKKTSISGRLKIENSAIETLVLKDDVDNKESLVSINNTIANPIVYE
jgi:hypothetical protein